MSSASSASSTLAPPSAVELPQIVPAWNGQGGAPSPGSGKSGGGEIRIATAPPNHEARPPAVSNADSLPWLGDDIKETVVSPSAQPIPGHFSIDKTPGITRIPAGEDLFVALDKLGLMYSTEYGTSCWGRIIDNDEIGVVERQGQVKFTKPGQWKIWDMHTNWSDAGAQKITSPIIQAKGVAIVSLNQRQVAVAKDQDGRSMLLHNGRFILISPAVLFDFEIISLVDLPKQKQVQRFGFFNVPQGEVAGITLPTGQVRILLPGVHVVEDCKFERFLPTVPIQSKLKKEVITSDMVTVSLEVDIATQLVDCARFLKMSAAAAPSSAGASAPSGSDRKHKSDRKNEVKKEERDDGQSSVGCKDLYDAIEESAQSHFVDTFGKTQYYNFRTRQGEVESKFEENALEVLDREARKYGGRILKINILKQRADAVEQVYATHNKQQVELEQKKQSQQRQYDIDESEQKHRQIMAEREEKGTMLKQSLQQERELARKDHELKLALQDAKARQEKLDFESKAIAERQKFQAIAESEANKIRAAGEAEQRAAKILVVAQANAKAEELKSEAAAKAENMKAQSRVNALASMASVLKSNPAMLELERQRVADELQVRKLKMLVAAGATVLPIEMMKVLDVHDPRTGLKRMENEAVLRVMGMGSAAAAGGASGAGSALWKSGAPSAKSAAQIAADLAAEGEGGSGSGGGGMGLGDFSSAISSAVADTNGANGSNGWKKNKKNGNDNKF